VTRVHAEDRAVGSRWRTGAPAELQAARSGGSGGGPGTTGGGRRSSVEVRRVARWRRWRAGASGHGGSIEYSAGGVSDTPSHRISITQWTSHPSHREHRISITQWTSHSPPSHSGHRGSRSRRHEPAAENQDRERSVSTTRAGQGRPTTRMLRVVWPGGETGSGAEQKTEGSTGMDQARWRAGIGRSSWYRRYHVPPAPRFTRPSTGTTIYPALHRHHDLPGPPPAPRFGTVPRGESMGTTLWPSGCRVAQLPARSASVPPPTSWVRARPFPRSRQTTSFNEFLNRGRHSASGKWRLPRHFTKAQNVPSLSARVAV
jgi:hypothetical protein